MPLDFRAAQIIFFPDDRTPQVRLNSEVRAVARAKLKPGLRKAKGEPVFEHELRSLRKVALTGQEDRDCSHITFLRIGDEWTISFDFRYNKSLSKRHVETAKEFYAAARYSFRRRHTAALVDNLFSAAELSVRAILLSAPDPRYRQRGGHAVNLRRFNTFAHLGNIDRELCLAFNKLWTLRHGARYVSLEPSPPLATDEAISLITAVKKMIREASLRLRQ